MLAIGPRLLGADMNLDNIQFFTDYCNSTVIRGIHYSSGWLPTFKVIALGMLVDMSKPENPDEIQTKRIVLTQTEKTYIEKLYSSEGWVAYFTARDELESIELTADEASKDILNKILARFDSTYTGDIFILSTFKFKKAELKLVDLDNSEGAVPTEPPLTE